MSIRFHWMHRQGSGNSSKELVETAQKLENANITSILLPYGPKSTDFLLHVPKILESTNQIKIMIALPAYAITPEYVLKTFLTMQQFGKDRLDINLVAGNYSKEIEEDILKNYPGDISLINSHEKRVNLTEIWMDKFYNLAKGEDFKTTLYVVGSSDKTIEVANKYADYLIMHSKLLNDGYLDKVINAKVLLTIDPLIINPWEDISKVEYHKYDYTKEIKHPISGSFQEVYESIKTISNKFNINDFMIHTDQKNIKRILRLSKEITGK